MARRKLPYRLGDVVRIPLGEAGQALGVLARVDGRGGCLGYFFIGKDTGDVPHLRPDQADLIKIFGDLGLLDGTWTVLGPLPGFYPETWPLPPQKEPAAAPSKRRRAAA